MNRGTDLEANYVAQPDSNYEGLDPVYVSVETVGQLVVPRDLNGPTLYLPSLDNLAKTAESIRPTLEAFTEVSKQISRMGLKTLGKRLAQWRKIQNAIISKRSKVSFPIFSRLEKLFRRNAVAELRKLLCKAQPPQIIGTFIQQVFDTNSLMQTGPPLLSTGLPINDSVTTWGREA
jgi:hypothetical protein